MKINETKENKTCVVFAFT